MTSPVVVVCVDGFQPEYAEAAIDHGRMPAFARMRAEGSYALARTVIPSFTNPNNISIVTGATPAEHGICGNYFYDDAAGQEVLMDHPRYLRRTTLLGEFSGQGMRVGAITAKEKLRRLLGEGWRGICFSGELADTTTESAHGIAGVERRVGMAKPGMYSAAMSDFVMACGIHLLEQQRLDLLYLSLTDFVQHTYPPGAPEADAFFAGLDGRLGQIDALGAILVVTGDHGMNDKSAADGTPNVVYLEAFLGAALRRPFRVVLPITDPHVTHHAGLGSYATVHLEAGDVAAARARLLEEARIEAVLSREQAAARFGLPLDRIGDLVVLGRRDSVFGKRPEFHDLSALRGKRLRSHGGVHESIVPFLLNRRLKSNFAQRLGSVRNWDAFDFALNGAAP